MVTVVQAPWRQLSLTRQEVICVPGGIQRTLCVHACAPSCPTLCDPMDCSPPGYSVHGIFQAITLEWAAISFSGGYSQSRDHTPVSWSPALAGGFFPTESHGSPGSMERAAIARQEVICVPGRAQGTLTDPKLVKIAVRSSVISGKQNKAKARKSPANVNSI